MNEQLRRERALRRSVNAKRAYRQKPKDVENPVWLSTAEAARYLGLSDRTVHVLVEEDGLPCYRFGRVFRFRLSDLQAYIERARVGSGRKAVGQ